MCKLTIITINYNNKNGLEKTVNSVLNQTYDKFEYIIIDGASVDGSKEFIQQNSDKINLWLSEKDLGIFNAMNKGIRASKGEFLLFLNSGDCLYNNFVIELIIEKLDSGTGIYYGNMISSENGKEKFLSKLPKKLTFSFFLVFSLPHQASFIRKSLFENNFYYNETYKIVSDWEFFLYCICKKQVPYKHLDTIVSDFDITGISSNVSNLETLNLEKQKVIEEHFPLFLKDAELLKEIKTRRFQQFLNFKRHKLTWKLLKFVMNILNLFHSRTVTEFNEYYHKIK